MRRVHLIALLLSVALAGAPDSSSRQTSKQDSPHPSGAGTFQKLANPLNDLLDEAQRDLDRKDYQAATAPLTKILAEAPGSAYAHFQLGFAYTGLKRFDDAQSEYRRAAELDPTLAQAHLNLGLLLMEKDPAAAVAPLRRAADLLPSQGRPRYLLGRALEGSGDLPGAAEALRQAEVLDPQDLNTLLALGRVLLNDTHASEAEEMFRAALAVQPNSAPAQLGLARSLQAQKKPESAEAMQRYLELHPEDRAAPLRRAQQLFAAKQFDAALAELNKLDAAGGSQGDSLRLRIAIQDAQSHWNDVVTAAHRLAELAPKDGAVHAELGRAYLHLREYPSAISELKLALQVDGNDLPSWQDLSAAYYLGGDCISALAAFDEVARRTTPAVGVWFSRATCYDKLNRTREALDAYRKFVELDANQHPNQTWQAQQRIKVLQRRSGGN